jgi:hypothetical protein
LVSWRQSPFLDALEYVQQDSAIANNPSLKPFPRKFPKGLGLNIPLAFKGRFRILNSSLMSFQFPHEWNNTDVGMIIDRLFIQGWWQKRCFPVLGATCLIF